ncbi:hypothetical protein SU69_07235 [Thermosipho melanesiensis]|uniref:Uncharacterized protein n=2 Tax=Thermosipho melanesiensis TaxID=46541 RepID=A6LMX4_THEM4|nr:hypothetical protein [Thermosipho melanesiensis]ABR31275.1 hypothetical protein Tmel_1428 [Thermosipho melanesiensis BI429]APT74903.1 hypothetical protein BW47_07560 [Thermosipho melanesiensis]OOC36298.1 hypothetical protein SU68_07305 [Thermosipho melanesiensis]OOC37116.1 hypothetical protein SU69_07235 [Thermosipho melanesiensis]OOC37868.1 hypothetical protein SU70_07245 [Thermosipho melanesiensis]
MRIIKNVIKTLKQELGLIKINDIKTNMNVTVTFEKVNLKTNLYDESIKANIVTRNFKFTPKLSSTSISNTTINVAKEEITQSRVKIKNISFENLNINNKSLTFQSKDVNIYEEDIYFKTTINAIDIPKPKIKSKIPPILFEVIIYPSKVVSKEKILKILREYILTQKNKDIKFIGFFKNVPLGYAEKIIITNNKLTVILNKKGKNFVSNVVIFKIDGKYKLEVIK